MFGNARFIVELSSLLTKFHPLTPAGRNDFSLLVCNLTRDNRSVYRVGESHMREGGPLALAKEFCVFNGSVSGWVNQNKIGPISFP